MNSCETCKHSYDMPDWYEPMWKSIPADIVKHCSLVGLAEYGKDGCAYEPINNIELPASRVTQEGHDG